MIPPPTRSQHTTTLAPGTEVVSGYDELALLRRAEFATTYRARRESGDVVALKVLAIGSDDDGHVRKALNRHWLAAQQVSDLPNVLAVLDSGTTSAGRPYVATQYCAGGSLGDRVEHGAALPATDVLNAAVQIGLALHEAHSVELCHRGIKPSNIMVDGNEHAMLAEFVTAGLRAERGFSAHDVDFGYLAPEIVNGGKAGPGSDVYALAATVVHLLAGRAPSGDRGAAALLDGMLDDAAANISRSDGAKTLRLALARALAPDPADRVTDALAFAAEIHTVLVHLGLPTRYEPSRLPERTGPEPVAVHEPPPLASQPPPPGHRLLGPWRLSLPSHARLLAPTDARPVAEPEPKSSHDPEPDPDTGWQPQPIPIPLPPSSALQVKQNTQQASEKPPQPDRDIAWRPDAVQAMPEPMTASVPDTTPAPSSMPEADLAWQAGSAPPQAPKPEPARFYHVTLEPELATEPEPRITIPALKEQATAPASSLPPNATARGRSVALPIRRESAPHAQHRISLHPPSLSPRRTKPPAGRTLALDMPPPTSRTHGRPRRKRHRTVLGAALVLASVVGLATVAAARVYDTRTTAHLASGIMAPADVAPMPTDLIAVDEGPEVLLSWTLPPEAEGLLVAIAQTPSPPDREALVVLEPGTATYVATELDPRTRYCFVAGLVLRTDEGGSDGPLSWSKPACVRGAFLPPSAPRRQRGGQRTGLPPATRSRTQTSPRSEARDDRKSDHHVSSNAGIFTRRIIVVLALAGLLAVGMTAAVWPTDRPGDYLCSFRLTSRVWS